MTHANNQTTPSSHYRLRIALLWGAAYGAVWSMAPGFFSKLMSSPGEAATVVIAGAITGVLVSMALAPGLASSRRWVAVCLGLLSLPLGAGLFGVVASWLHWGVMKLTGTHYRFVMQIDEPPGYVFEPLKTGRDYALYSTLSVLGLVFIPLAIMTTLHLHRQLGRSRPLPQV